MRTLFLFVATVMTLTPACSADKPEPRTAAAADQQGPALNEDQERAVAKAGKESGGGLNFDDEILRLCPAIKPPKFGYNSANVQTHFRSSLVELAKCMNEGGLKGRNLLLIGHADPRGEDDYNLALGGRRADSVQVALGKLGVSDARLNVTSRGELDSKGTDEKSYSEDRRVDVKLASR